MKEWNWWLTKRTTQWKGYITSNHIPIQCWYYLTCQAKDSTAYTLYFIVFCCCQPTLTSLLRIKLKLNCPENITGWWKIGSVKGHFSSLEKLLNVWRRQHEWLGIQLVNSVLYELMAALVMVSGRCSVGDDKEH